MVGIVGLLFLAVVPQPSSAADLNPISRVVQLMEGLIKKTESDGKAEEDLFDAYVCWYKTVVSSKKASNAEAKDRIESLTAYIDDVKSGRIEFTSERKDLEVEIEKLNTEIETATDMRNKENEDFLAAKDEMEKAIAALEKAIEVLGDATFLQRGSLTSVGFDLRRAVEIGQNFLSEQDARFLEQVLDGQVPKADWKKLNRKATFKMKYKARSTKIQDILADMLQTFEDNLADATKKEKDTKASFDTLMEAKNSQLSAAQDALSGGEGEGAARTLAADEAQEEVDALTTQVSDDEKYISATEASYADKVTEWKERKRLRTEEIASISKAIEILASDDAKDLMASSFKSQGGFFLQESSEGCSKQKRATKVVHKLRNMATKHRDPRLSALAVALQLNSRGHFDKIVEEVMKMVSDLHEEADEDLKTKETCEADRMTNTKTAKKSAQAMDDETALINRKKADIEAMQKEIAGIVEHVKELKLQLEEAQIQRAKENREFKAGKADDEAAAVLIGKSKEVLEKFYADNGLALAQTSFHAAQRSGSAQPEVVAGEAPPPPPSTFSEPYGGNKGASNGIMSLLDMVKADVEKDIKTATAEEDSAKQEYDTFKTETEALIKSLESQKSGLEGEVGDAETAVVNAKKTRKDKKKVLDDTMAFLKSIAPSCDYMAVNFELRKANREAEIDGLIEAGASLQGGVLAKDGFLQKGNDEC